MAKAKNQVPPEVINKLIEPRRKLLKELEENPNTARIWCSNNGNIVYSNKAGMRCSFMTKAEIKKEKEKNDIINYEIRFVQIMQKELINRLNDKTLFDYSYIYDYINNIFVSNHNKKWAIKVDFKRDCDVIFKCSTTVKKPTSSQGLNSVIKAGVGKIKESLEIEGIDDSIRDKIKDTYKEQMKKYGYSSKKSFIDDIKKAHEINLINNYEAIKNAINKNEYTPNEFWITRNGISFYYINETWTYDILNKELTVTNNTFEKLKEYETAKKEINKIKSFCSKNKLKFRIKNIDKNEIILSIKFKHDKAERKKILIKRPFLIKNEEKQIKQYIKKQKEAIKEIERKKKEKQKEFDDLKLDQNMLCVTICDLVDKNRFITPNMILYVMRNRKLNQNTESYLSYKEHHRLYNLIPEETIRNELNKLLFYNVLNTQRVSSMYHNDYDKIVKGNKFTRLKLKESGFTKKCWQNAETDAELKHFLKGGFMQNDISAIPKILDFPNVYCECEDLIKKYIDSIENKENAKLYIKSKSELLKESENSKDKIARKILKNMEKML